MEHFNDTQKLQILERIANHLMLKTSSSDDLGLYNGKIGVVLFFYHYAKHTDNQLYDDFAGLILDEIYNEMHELLPIAFSNGIIINTIEAGEVVWISVKSLSDKIVALLSCESAKDIGTIYYKHFQYKYSSFIFENKMNKIYKI